MDITIKVLGEFDNVSTRIQSHAAPTEVIERQIRQAIASLEAEITDLHKCPYHMPVPYARNSRRFDGALKELTR